MLDIHNINICINLCWESHNHILYDCCMTNTAIYSHLMSQGFGFWFHLFHRPTVRVILGSPFHFGGLSFVTGKRTSNISLKIWHHEIIS